MKFLCNTGNIDRMVAQTFEITHCMQKLGYLLRLASIHLMRGHLHQIGSQFIFVFVDQIFLFLNFVELII